VVHAAVILLRVHAYAHEEAVEEDACGRNSKLGELEHNSGLIQKIDALGSAITLVGRGKTIQNGRRVGQFGLGEDPLAVFGRHFENGTVDVNFGMLLF